MSAKEQTLKISAVLKKVSKDWDLRVGSLSNVAAQVQVVSSGNIAIDEIIGVGGIPLGRCIELFGPPSCGKTTTALQAAAQLQKEIIASGQEEYILYLDYENSLDVNYAKSLGLDMNHSSFLFAQPDTFEQGTNAAVDLIETGMIRLVIFDSVAAMTPNAIVEADVGQATVAVLARLMASFLQKLNPILSNNKCTAIFLNHLKEAIAMGGFQPPGGPQKVTPGGKALKYYASVRLEYQQIKNITVMVLDEITGQDVKRVESTNVKVRVVKNKVGPPFREALVRVRFGRGFDDFWNALQILTGRKLIVLNAGYYYFDKLPDLVLDDMDVSSTGRPNIRGEEVILAFADAHPMWREAVINLARDTIREKAVTPLPVEDAPSVELFEKELAKEEISQNPAPPVATKSSNVVGLASLLGEDDQLFAGAKKVDG